MAHNNLTDQQAELLALLCEELGEAQQAIGKILRHGYYSYNPFRPELGSNKDQLCTELGDVLASVKLLVDSGEIQQVVLEMHRDAKLINVRQYLHHN